MKAICGPVLALCVSGALVALGPAAGSTAHAAAPCCAPGAGPMVGGPGGWSEYLPVEGDYPGQFAGPAGGEYAAPGGYAAAPYPAYAPAGDGCGASYGGYGAAEGYGAGSAVGYAPGGCGPSGYGATGYGAAPACVGAAAPVAWGGRVGVLWIDRDDENHHKFSYDSANEALQLLDSRDAAMGGGLGVDARVTRTDLCSGTGWEAGYWGAYPDASSATVMPSQVTGTLNGILNFSQLNYNGVTADNSVNNARLHRVRREHDLHSAEINHFWLVGDPCAPCRARWLTGFRYLRFGEALAFDSDPSDGVFTGAPDELTYSIDADNHLFGWQLGGSAGWNNPCSPLTADLGAKVALCGLHASADSRIGGAAGTAVVNNGPNNGQAWMVDASKGDVAMLAELNAGVGYRVGCWTLRGEYRAVAVSGLALPTNQIYHDLRGLQDVRQVQTNGSLLLHGALLSLERCY